MWFCPVLRTAPTRKIPSSLRPAGCWVCSNPSNTARSQSKCQFGKVIFDLSKSIHISAVWRLSVVCCSCQTVSLEQEPGRQDDLILYFVSRPVLRSCCKLWWWWRMRSPPVCTPGSAGCCSGQTVCPPQLHRSEVRGRRSEVKHKRYVTFPIQNQFVSFQRPGFHFKLTILKKHSTNQWFLSWFFTW